MKKEQRTINSKIGELLCMIVPITLIIIFGIGFKNGDFFFFLLYIAFGLIILGFCTYKDNIIIHAMFIISILAIIAFVIYIVIQIFSWNGVTYG